MTSFAEHRAWCNRLMQEVFALAYPLLYPPRKNEMSEKPWPQQEDRATAFNCDTERLIKACGLAGVTNVCRLEILVDVKDLVKVSVTRNVTLAEYEEILAALETPPPSKE